MFFQDFYKCTLHFIVVVYYLGTSYIIKEVYNIRYTYIALIFKKLPKTNLSNCLPTNNLENLKTPFYVILLFIKLVK